MTLAHIAAKQPLVHCMTNTVVTNFTANGLLAIGASPIMADAMEEAAHITSIADALLINIGTIQAHTVEAMHAAMKSAKAHHKPVVLDPVGAGASRYRIETVRALLTHGVTLIRGNAGELAAIAGVTWSAKGVDGGDGEADVAHIAKTVAKAHRCIVVITGEEDVVTDGETVIHVAGGNAQVTRITGSGCLLSAIVAALLASCDGTLEQIAALLAQYKEAAVNANGFAGTYAVTFLDALQQLSEVDV
ncbi:hydroxyethylthiazole kinase [Caryophanon latum]|uniref:Hydroxyethylthiazole kinase n=1 Tax=Caryophanon latum TaxID=33977 RepID=A0A1C0YZV9_9BACL|nr:hydroxyethylthiazole kinase [Caryophanon latum]OCS92675.1 hydroxyethylthiazole kinase [Caryophanon latum]